MNDLKRFSYDELFRGIVSTLILIFIYKWFGIVVSIVTGILWMLGGTYHTSIRREGIPILLFMIKISSFQWWHLISLILGIYILHQGDGFPDHRPTTQDPGSRLGRFVERFYPEDSVGGPITKWIIVVLFQLSLIPYFIG